MNETGLIPQIDVRSFCSGIYYNLVEYHVINRIGGVV